jgi:2-polyprenyl-6-methoxyphenol hydroxylase-like FAD-dependent oxidoreductase
MEHDKQSSPAISDAENVDNAKQVHEATCCIVGGGPAGAVLALLLARQGIRVTLLESHLDFDRDFRGDTLHPSVMEILDEIGLAERLLQLRHTKLSTFGLQTRTGTFRLRLDFGKTKFPYITVIAQSRFLEFMTEEAKHYPNFELIMGSQADALIEEDGVVRGVQYRDPDGLHTIRAALVVGADGRFSRVRKLAGFEPIKTSPPIDVLWFRLTRRATDSIESLDARIGNGLFVIFIDRFDYWQVGCVIPKGGYQQLHAAGLDQFRQSWVKTVPELAERVEELRGWKQISVLSVESSRLKRWHKPGLLLIGDAAHVMSPAGGVGINYAIADAVVTTNVLGEKLLAGIPLQESDLAEVQRQRELPTRVVQLLQSFLQKVALARATRAGSDSMVVPLALARLLAKLPWLTAIPGRYIGFGLWPPHVKMEMQQAGTSGSGDSGKSLLSPSDLVRR